MTMTMTIRNLLFSTILSFGLLSGAALAADKDDIRMLNKTKISLSAAIAAAENHHDNARALSASIDDDSTKPAYEISIVDKDDRVFDVMIDGVTGTIMNSREDIDD